MTAKSPEGGRLGQLLAMLAARTHADGTARPGYKQNVASIRAELAHLQKISEGGGGQ